MREAPATIAKRHAQRGYNTANFGRYAERIDAIRATLLNARIEPHDLNALLAALPDADGKLLRFPTASKRCRKNGWLFALFDRGLPVCVIAGDWSTGAEARWIAEAGKTLTDAERRELKHRIAETKQAREAELASLWEHAAIRAAQRWHYSVPAGQSHAYLLRKGIQPHSARQQGQELVLLLTDFNGKAWSLQTIDGVGNKRLMSGGRKAGNFIVIGGPDNPARVLICEGFATGCTLAEMDPAALVLAAVDAGNLRAVTTGARNRWPDADIIVCGDDDRQTSGNPGVTAARSAAIAAGAKLALPQWPEGTPLHLTDFNDLVNWQRESAA